MTFTPIVLEPLLYEYKIQPISMLNPHGLITLDQAANYSASQGWRTVSIVDLGWDQGLFLERIKASSPLIDKMPDNRI